MNLTLRTFFSFFSPFMNLECTLQRDRVKLPRLLAVKVLAELCFQKVSPCTFKASRSDMCPHEHGCFCPFVEGRDVSDTPPISSFHLIVILDKHSPVRLLSCACVCVCAEMSLLCLSMCSPLHALRSVELILIECRQCIFIGPTSDLEDL